MYSVKFPLLKVCWDFYGIDEDNFCSVQELLEITQSLSVLLCLTVTSLQYLGLYQFSFFCGPTRFAGIYVSVVLVSPCRIIPYLHCRIEIPTMHVDSVLHLILVKLKYAVLETNIASSVLCLL